MKKLISRAVAREAALYFHGLEKQGELHRRAEIFVTQDKVRFLWVEVLYEDGKVKVSTYSGAPKQDGSNVTDTVVGSIKDYYQVYGL
jgi:hypothetical protein